METDELDPRQPPAVHASSCRESPLNLRNNPLAVLTRILTVLILLVADDYICSTRASLLAANRLNIWRFAGENTDGVRISRGHQACIDAVKKLTQWERRCLIGEGTA